MYRVLFGLSVIGGSILYASHGIPNSYSPQNLYSQSIGFERNLGQVNEFKGNTVKGIFFRTNFKDFSVFLTEKGASYVIYRSDELTEGNSQKPNSRKPEENPVRYARIDLELLNSEIKESEIVYEDELPGYSNYYSPQYPDGILYVRSYTKVRIKNVYPGVDWIWKIENGELHHEFEISPGADIDKIKLKVKYADVSLEEYGKKLIYSTPIGRIEDGEVLAFENGEKVDISYKLYDGLISFIADGWSGMDKLVIDPPLSLLWGTYYGGNSDEYGFSITTDDSGNVFITGYTYSSGFPTYDPGGGTYFQGTMEGPYDAYILKFSNAGVRQWATYYGGSSYDRGEAIAADNAGNVFVTGLTWSTDFPTYDPGGGAYYQGTKAGYDDIFILKFTGTGIREWATYYGGSGTELGASTVTDNSGNVLITGETSSIDFPTYDPGGGAYYQAFAGGSEIYILKFSNTGVRQWATYYGGSGLDHGNSITTDTSGNILVTGNTYSMDFPTHDPGGGAYYQGSFTGVTEIFLLKFSNTGSREWATYYGGSGGDDGISITTDGSGNIFVTGYTNSTDFPTYDPGGGAYYQGTNAGSDDMFILKFSNSGLREWATYYGGTFGDRGYSVATGSSGNAFVTGRTYSADFPTQNPGGGAYYQGANAGHDDIFILEFTSNSAVEWATYYGGIGGDVGNSISIERAGDVFVTGNTGSTDFPTQDPGGGAYYQGTLSGYSGDVFVLKFGTIVEGDVDGDGLVDFLDLEYLANYLFYNGPGPSPFLRGDVNGDCDVTDDDLVYLSSYLLGNGSSPVICTRKQ